VKKGASLGLGIRNRIAGLRPNLDSVTHLLPSTGQWTVVKGVFVRDGMVHFDGTNVDVAHIEFSLRI
jgi:hypothetical protein